MWFFSDSRRRINCSSSLFCLFELLTFILLIIVGICLTTVKKSCESMTENRLRPNFIGYTPKFQFKWLYCKPSPASQAAGSPTDHTRRSVNSIIANDRRLINHQLSRNCWVYPDDDDKSTDWVLIASLCYRCATKTCCGVRCQSLYFCHTEKFTLSQAGLSNGQLLSDRSFARLIRNETTPEARQSYNRACDSE